MVHRLLHSDPWISSILTGRGRTVPRPVQADRGGRRPAMPPAEVTEQQQGASQQPCKSVRTYVRRRDINDVRGRNATSQNGIVRTRARRTAFDELAVLDC